MTESFNPSPVLPVPVGYHYRRRAALASKEFLRVYGAIRLVPDGDILIRNEHNQQPWLAEWKGRATLWLTFYCRTPRAATFLKFLVGGDEIAVPARMPGKPVIRIMATAVVRPDPRGPVVY